MPSTSATLAPSRDDEAPNGAQDLKHEGVESKDTYTRSSIHLAIVKKESRPLVSNRLTLFSLPGELRNTIYHLALSTSYQRVPLNPAYNGRSELFASLLQTCSAIYHEARSYMTEQQTLYIPVMCGMDWTYGEPTAEYGLTRATKDTIVAALGEFVDVHFHLHIELLDKEEYDPNALLKSLAQATEVFSKPSFDLYVAHGLRKRRAMVHLDHLLSLWPKLFASHNSVDFEVLQRVMDRMGDDKMTDWELRYYVATGQAGQSSTYGHCNSPAAIRDAELAQLRYHAQLHGNIKIVAEIYGDDTTWAYGDKVQSVTRHRTPVTEFWPNVHFDGSRYAFVTYDDFQSTYPDTMPLENFDDEVLQAAQEDRARRRRWVFGQSWVV
ncbi:hypothetical protein BKA63DRAFT_419790 [Paraphoma chrysanthemicola]|nr:hypothetical protein BKA63DRAFT_419790 [Paraphoma chrysanthemicola]